MKLWEIIKELTEDPTKKFEAKPLNGWTLSMSVDTGISRYFKFDVFYGKKLIEQSSDRGAFNGNVALDLDWQLVKQPVTWQEAIQAWVDGKTISYSYKGYDRRYGFKDSDTMLLTIEKIEDGKWYIESEVK